MGLKTSSTSEHLQTRFPKIKFTRKEKSNLVEAVVELLCHLRRHNISVFFVVVKKVHQEYKCSEISQANEAAG